VREGRPSCPVPENRMEQRVRRDACLGNLLFGSNVTYLCRTQKSQGLTYLGSLGRLVASEPRASRLSNPEPPSLALTALSMAAISTLLHHPPLVPAVLTSESLSFSLSPQEALALRVLFSPIGPILPAPVLPATEHQGRMGA